MSAKNQSIVPADLTTMLQQLRLNIFQSLNCVKVGKITKFDPVLKTVEVQVLFKRVTAAGDVISYPTLVDCPVFTLQGGGGFVRFPIAAGDNCLVIFSDRDLDLWFETGQEGAPLTARTHDLSDGIALVGLNSKASDMPAYEDGAAEMFLGGATVGMKGSKITFENQATTLLAAVEGLIDVLKALQVQDPISGPVPLTAASIAALQAQKAVFEGLLNT